MSRFNTVECGKLTVDFYTKWYLDQWRWEKRVRELAKCSYCGRLPKKEDESCRGCGVWLDGKV